MARGHEQAVASGAAEAEVGAAFGQRDEGDRLAGGIENLDPVLLGVAHAPAAPEIAVDIADLDHARGHTRLDDVEFLLIGREGKPVRRLTSPVATVARPDFGSSRY